MPAQVIAIQLCLGHRQPMRSVSSATLHAGLGLEGDKHAGAASKRQVLIADKEALDAVGVEPGVIKENLTVEGLEAMRLPVGARLRIGASAVVEITGVCEPCFRMDEIRDGLRQELDGRRGMLSRVLEGGAIQVGDPITLEQPHELAS